MKILIEGSDEKWLTISGDSLESDADVQVDLNGETAVFQVNELMSALIAFDSKRSRRLSEEAERGINTEV